MTLLCTSGRATQWPEILGAAITGPNTRVVLHEIPLVGTTWSLLNVAAPFRSCLVTVALLLEYEGGDHGLSRCDGSAVRKRR